MSIIYHTIARIAVTTALAATAALGSGTATATTVAPSPDPARSCRDITFPTRTGPLETTIHGVLCAPTTHPIKGTQVLLHGATYNSQYWDPPVANGKYSYAKQMNNAGYRTLALDRLGAGTSSRPPSVLLSVDNQADAVHQVITHLKAGHLIDAPARRIALVGHSMGSAVATVEQTTFHDVDAVVMTGATAHIDPAFLLTTLTNYMMPATLDPKFGPFSGQLVDPLYLTTRPGVRSAAFHAATDVDPEVVQVDEATKDLVATTEILGAITKGWAPETTRRITVPTMVQLGGADNFFCPPGRGDCSSAETLARAVEHDFAPAAQLHTSILPAAGHDLQLARNGATAAAEVSSWMDRALP
ncbi:alpha/beta hydrolase [Amycolatopsis sp. CA-230715]|uniref:alpha/beta hydrolase n=1 Tax=Amycolatopsis sp. CA-230715 TaxID=2745196 RepID=UPI001C01FEED|nr:alpha/beta fold hydrolase [Amycolatopsis sp. CA-230715]QWF85865.1 hypothetical protein HUW46_09345 [Amycolatopsis sp. CA-230715]